MPVLAALEAEDVSTPALDGPSLHMADLDGVAAVRAGTPGQEPVALDEAVGDEMLVLQLDPWVGDESDHSLVVHHDVAAPGALDHLTGSLVNDLGGEVLSPALGAEQVAALKPRHHLARQREAADVTVQDRG